VVYENVVGINQIPNDNNVGKIYHIERTYGHVCLSQSF